MEIRLQKYLANCGIASRRYAEKLIQDGKIKVNNKVVTILGTKINPENDVIKYQDKIVRYQKGLIYYAVNKPKGYTTSLKDIYAKKLITELVPKEPRVYPVGRLDKDSEGLIILTNDGDFANYLTHPRFEHEKEYFIKASCKFDPQKIKSRVLNLSKGFILDRQDLQPMKISDLYIDQKIKIINFTITLKEGKNRQIRRICQKIGLNVITLKRIRIGKLRLTNDLKLGTCIKITKDDIIN